MTLFFRNVSFYAPLGTIDYEVLTWTTFQQSSVDKIYYVSDSTGSNGYNGLTSSYVGGVSGPVSTLAQGISLLSGGSSDWLLLKDGDTWNNQSLGTWTKCGRSRDYMIRVGRYGNGNRPKINTGLNSIVSPGNPAGGVNYVAFTGFEAYPGSYDGTGNQANGINWVIGSNGSSSILLEDLHISKYGDNNILPQGNGTLINETRVSNPLVDFRMRGCTVLSAWGDYHYTYNQGDSGNTIEGLYCYGTVGMRIEHCLFDENGWVTPSGQHPLRRNFYIDNVNEDVQIKNSWVLKTEGTQLRCGGRYTGNVHISGVAGITLGAGSDPNQGGVSAQCENNIILGVVDPKTEWYNSMGLGCHITISNVSGGSVKGNICANSTCSGESVPLKFDKSQAIKPWICASAVIADNIFHNAGNWAMYFFPGETSSYAGNVFSGNVVQNPNNENYSTYYHTNNPTGAALIYIGSLSLTSSHFLMQNNSYYKVPSAVVGNYDVQNGGHMSLTTFLSQFSDTTSTSGLKVYLDPNRNLAGYNAYLGGTSSSQAFEDSIKSMHKGNWDNAKTAPAFASWFRKGFVIVG